MDKSGKTARMKKLAALLLCFVLTAAMFLPLTALAKAPDKTVRVGWFESPFNSTDSTGRRGGYAYEYQLKVAAYAGWNYSYVSGSWPDLLQKLKEGKIDLLADVSYTEERTHEMFFSELPMGTEEYCIFIAPNNREITAEDYSTLNGKRIGVNKDSVQIGCYTDWAAKHGVFAELVELTTTEVDSLDLLDAGKIDAYITLNAYGDPARLVPVCKIGASDFYFAVNPERTDLIRELNAAMDRIQNENPYYNQRMFEKYMQRFGSNAFLSVEEKEWLDAHGAIRVGYQDNYLAFCAGDAGTGELTGALKDILNYASDCFSNAHIDFSMKAYPTASAAVEALRRGEIDCVFPVNLGAYDGETMHLLVTPPLMRADVYAVVRKSESSIFANREHVIVAVNDGNPNYDAFLAENYPRWRSVHFPTTEDCLAAVSTRLADCLLIANYRYNNIARQCERYRLTTYDTGRSADYSFAVAEGETELYSILAKAEGLMPASTVNAALSYYITEDAKLTLFDFLLDNIVAVFTVTALVLLVILFFLLRSLYTERRARELIAATETDKLTGLYNRNYFFEYADRIYRENQEARFDAIVLNIEQFHSVNALFGWEFGDRVLCVLATEAAAVAKENDGICGRFGADRFDIYCKQIGDVQALFDRLQNKLTSLTRNAAIRLRMGVMPWQAELEPIQMFDRARTACHLARGQYTGRPIVFDEQVRERELLDQRLLGDLRRGLENYEFEVFYQPQYDIGGDKPRLCGAEALVRWRHPELGMLKPDRFIPLFERSGKIGELDRYVWDKAARQLSRWRSQFGLDISVSVNLSRVDVFDPSLPDTLDTLLAQNGLDHKALALEITETAYTENTEDVIRAAEVLRSRGYLIEMDDFGTGYSSLNMLSLMPVDVLKMDRSFVRTLTESEKDAQLVALIIGTAQNLDLPLVAEGVETEAQLQMLKKLGCKLVQGFYFASALHPSEFEEKILLPAEEQP
ncbi:MAG: EAL domain-containing protein [Clostridia bacterium]|nr:EAL domain-containing protein [Clostridia bacterium]